MRATGPSHVVWCHSMHTMAAAEVRGAEDGDVRAPKVKFRQERSPSPAFSQKRPKLRVAAKSTQGSTVGEEAMARPGLVRVFWDERGQMKVLELPSDATARECVDAMALKTCKEDYGDDFEQHLPSYLGQYGDCILVLRGSKRPLSPERKVVWHHPSAGSAWLVPVLSAYYCRCQPTSGKCLNTVWCPRRRRRRRRRRKEEEEDEDQE